MRTDLPRSVVDRLVPPLVSAEAARDLNRIWEFTGPLTSHFGFEVRLRGTCEDVDLGFLVEEAEARNLVHFSALRDEEGPSSAAWRRIGEFSRRWLDDAALRARVPHFWLEFDRDSCTASVPVPSLFFALDPPADCSSAEFEVETAAEVLGVVADTDPDSDELHAIRLCKERLGRFGQVLNLGVLLGRTPSSTRISVLLPAPEAVPYLQRVGWSGDLTDVARTLCPIEPLLRDVQLDFDVGARLGARVGVGLRVASSCWGAVLDQFVCAGIACTEHARALLAWKDGSGASAESDSMGFYISHIKVDHRGSGSSLKGYVGVISKH